MKCLVQTSGGMDSAAALLLMNEAGWECVPIFYAYGQPYVQQERLAALELTKSLGLPLHLYTISLCVKSTTAVPEYVPYRNLVLTAHSINAAAYFNCQSVVVGSKSVEVRTNDPYSFKDSSREFYTRLMTVVDFAWEPGSPMINIIMPVAGYSKLQIIHYLKARGIDLATLWSCYRDGPNPCGECHHCKEIAIAVAGAV